MASDGLVEWDVVAIVAHVHIIFMTYVARVDQDRMRRRPLIGMAARREAHHAYAARHVVLLQRHAWVRRVTQAGGGPMDFPAEQHEVLDFVSSGRRPPRTVRKRPLCLN